MRADSKGNGRELKTKDVQAPVTPKLHAGTGASHVALFGSMERAN
jgi:hypothetical protein